MASTAPILIELLKAARSAMDLRVLARRYRSLHVIPLTAPIGSRALLGRAQLASGCGNRGSWGAWGWRCDRHYELIAKVRVQPVRRVGR